MFVYPGKLSFKGFLPINNNFYRPKNNSNILYLTFLAGYLFFCQTSVQATADIQQQQQSQQQIISPHLLLQVQEDLRKLLEQRQVEEEKVRKELEGKVNALQRDSDKYRSELEHAQKEAESYRSRLEVERKENSKLHQLYEAAKQPTGNNADDRNSSSTEAENEPLL